MQDVRPVPEPRRRSWWRWLIGGIIGMMVGVVCGLVVSVGIGVMLLGGGSGIQDFDAARWRQSTAGCVAGNPRLGMYWDLEAQLLRERPTNAEVVRLLGPPDREPDAATIVYALGYNMIDCDSVSITFDTDDRVREVRYVQG